MKTLAAQWLVTKREAGEYGLIESAVTSLASPSVTPARSEWRARLGLVVGAVVLTLVVLELVLRACWGYLFLWPNFVVTARAGLASQERSRYAHDDLLGYVPRPFYASASVSIDADGLRGTGALPPTAGAAHPILAVGDSFTFGDEVGDSETWPAQLQRLSHRRVLNGGVGGYGFDQIVMRAERLAKAYRPEIIVVSFIADDIHRIEMRRLWGADKPYFELDGNKPVLRNVPVPPRADPQTTLSFWQRTLGYSFLFEFILRRLDLLHDWFGDHIRASPAGTGEALACRLTDRLAELQSKTGVRIVVLAEYDPVVWQSAAFAAEQRRLTKGLLGCAEQNKLEVLDSFDGLAGHPGKDGPRGLYVFWHMSDEGNGLIAGMVARLLNLQGN
jgi:hypothetical protein